MTTRQVFYEGRVQGVGFRFTARRIAMGFDVVGWVRNLPDGRVELQVEGEDDEVAAFLEELEENSVLAGNIRNAEHRDVEPFADARGFTIR